MLEIHVREAIVIAATPEKVWDYTQDWGRRREWDDGVLEVIEEEGEATGEMKP